MRNSYYLFSVSEKLKNFVYEIREYIFDIYDIDHEENHRGKEGRVLEQDIDNTQIRTKDRQTDDTRIPSCELCYVNEQASREHAPMRTKML